MVDRDPGLPFPPPRPERSRLVVAPPQDAPGYWAGAPSACLVDGTTYLAYRLRRPIGAGRGYAVVVARSQDGERFETLAVIDKDRMSAESLERPALVVTEDGAFRLYVSCATPGTKHWRVEVLEAADPAAFDPVRSNVVLPGSRLVGVKDPVIRHDGDKWHLWASCHPLADPDEADQMVTDYATSANGLEWVWQGTVLTGRPGRWDARGVRVSTVIPHEGRTVAFYDGRASAAENYEERTGVAVGQGYSVLVPQGEEPLGASPHAGGGLRYLDAVRVPGEGWRVYYEVTRADGAHELRTEFHPTLSQSAQSQPVSS
ncbi:hypothetical protein SAMN04489712_106148 [Thermomonospora echinospora]|uniref:Glycosyl hydrolases family 43 n=1 Tax=Thermomonospora echinospora TaxID=1992 RepID=A0A1H6B119_9ACTN|nr:hypothetical protein [Thermomonospora echinospora]SEG54290.1 hypothetical protein SAMN04489712_106148 [Thermomonospora echinospora]